MKILKYSQDLSFHSKKINLSKSRMIVNQCNIVSIERRKFHLVRYEIVCEPLTQGKLGIHSIEQMNKVLLGKWLWRVGDLSQGLWRPILIDKYKIGRDGWICGLLRFRIPRLAVFGSLFFLLRMILISG